MNSEYALDSCKILLESNLTAMLSIIEQEANATYFAPIPAEFFFGERDQSIMTQFPSIQVIGKNSGSKNDDYEYQIRQFKFDVITWVIEEDMEKLHRYILRYADAITRCIRKEDYWSSNLHSPVAGDAIYSELYRTDFGLAKGCLVTGQINYIIS
jgi:chlorite dismutase